MDCPVRYTEAPARRVELLRRLADEGYVSSAAVADELGVSEMTVRRDLRQLTLEGLARRVPGGATAPVGSTGTPFEERDRAGVAEKLAIARACAAELAGASTIALDAGTSVAAILPLLPAGVTIVSHSAPVITDCTTREDVDLIAIGGSYRRDTRSFAGSIARSAFASLSVDVAVLSATAVDGSGVLCANTFDAEIKQAMASIAGTTVLVVDHTKLGARAPIRVGPLDMIDVVITDSPASSDAVRMLQDTGVRVVLAELDAGGVLA